MSGLVFLAASWICLICYKNRYVFVELLVLHLLPLSNPWLIIEMWPVKVFSNKYYFGRCSSELVHLVPLPYSQEVSTQYSDIQDDFSVTICRCYKGVFVNSFFPHTATLRNSLPIECFAFTYGLNGFKSRKYLLNTLAIFYGSSKLKPLSDLIGHSFKRYYFVIPFYVFLSQIIKVVLETICKVRSFTCFIRVDNTQFDPRPPSPPRLFF